MWPASDWHHTACRRVCTSRSIRRSCKWKSRPFASSMHRRRCKLRPPSDRSSRSDFPLRCTRGPVRQWALRRRRRLIGQRPTRFRQNHHRGPSRQCPRHSRLRPAVPVGRPAPPCPLLPSPSAARSEDGGGALNSPQPRSRRMAKKSALGTMLDRADIHLSTTVLRHYAIQQVLKSKLTKARALAFVFMRFGRLQKAGAPRLPIAQGQ